MENECHDRVCRDMTVAIVNRSWLSPVKVMTSKEIDVREREIKRKEREKTGEVSFTICQT